MTAATGRRRRRIGGGDGSTAVTGRLWWRRRVGWTSTAVTGHRPCSVARVGGAPGRLLASRASSGRAPSRSLAGLAMAVRRRGRRRRGWGEVGGGSARARSAGARAAGRRRRAAAAEVARPRRPGRHARVEGSPGAVAVHVPADGVLARVGVGRALARSAGGPCRRGGPWYGLGRAAGGRRRRRRRALAVDVVRARAPHAIELVRRLRATASLEGDALLVGPLPFAHEGQWSG